MADHRWAGLALLVGGLVFFSSFVVAAIHPRLAQSGDAPDFAERLAAIGTHPRAWRTIFVLFCSAMLLTATGLGILAADGRLPAIAGFVAYVLATGAMVASLMFHFGPEVDAAKRLHETGAIPEWYEPLESWARSLYGAYMTGAFATLVLASAALWQPALVPGWVAASAAVFGLVMLVSFVTKRPSFGGFNPADLPLWVHVWGIFVGAFLVARH